jgi:hypothetical protein
MERFRRLVRKGRTALRRSAWRDALYAGLLKALRHRSWLQVLRAQCLESPDARLLELPEGYAGGFVAPRAVAEFARDAEAGIAEDFVAYAVGKGDKCYGVTYNGKLRGYGWYATTPTRISADLQLHFSRDYVYMYKAYTHRRHRGRRLFPISASRALRLYRAAGYKGMLLYVDATNLKSLRSCARMGFTGFGTIYVVRLFGRYFVYETPGCARYGVHIHADTPHFYRLSLAF